MRAVLLVAACALLLAGCGKKPRDVEPPPGSTAVFPRVYPPDSDDPAPKRAPDPPTVLRGKI